jgi:uncharacterized protein YcaQ
MQTLSLKQARKLILLSQRLPARKQTGTATAATLSAIEHLGYIQMDTISVVQRAHHHTLWNRNSRYQPKHLEQLLEEKKVFEYWSHAAAYLPMKDYRFSLYRKQAILSGEHSHWYRRNQTEMDRVLARIEREGPLMARDFDGDGKKMGAWQTKTAKMALENLYMQGDLMIPSRKNFQKVYDLTERVLPPDTDTRVPNRIEYARYLICSFLRANGLGQVAEMGYLLKGVKSILSETIQDMLSNKEIECVNVAKLGQYFVLPSTLSLLNKPYKLKKLQILSPFDNLLIQRKRMTALFNYDYLIECYTPEAKRQYGYFSLPILWNGELVARMDSKADRKNASLEIHHLAIEKSVKNSGEFIAELEMALPSFMAFNHCNAYRIHKVTKEGVDLTVDSHTS